MFADVLIIGTGISGLSFAIKLAQCNPEISMVLISKDQVSEGNTKYAQGGIAVVLISKRILLKSIYKIRKLLELVHATQKW